MIELIKKILAAIFGERAPRAEPLPDGYLSKHFALSEFTRSETAAQLGLANEPDADALANLHVLADALEAVRALAGAPINISSGYRNAEVNRAVGGVPNSDHQLGLAADFNASGWATKALVEAIANSDLQFDQLIWEQGNTSQWVHLGMGERMRREILSSKAGRTVQGLVKL